MTNKNSTKLLFKTYRQPITVINLTEANFNQGKDCLRATEIRKGHRLKSELTKAEIKAEAYDEMINVAESELGISIRKKSGAKQ